MYIWPRKGRQWQMGLYCSGRAQCCYLDIAIRFRLVSLMERPFTLPVCPQRALPSQGALSTVSCCLHRSSRYVTAPRRRRPPPCALPVWGCGRWPSPPFPSCFRPTRLFPSRETLCYLVNLTLRGRVRLARLQCEFFRQLSRGLEFTFGESEM